MGAGLGGLIGINRRPGKRSFGFLMGITAGVMISLSFLELVNEAWVLLGFMTATVGFGAGAIFMFLIDFFIPHIHFGEQEIHTAQEHLGHEFHSHPHHSRQRYRRFRGQNRIVDRQLLKTGMLLAIGITIHNIPEGIAVEVLIEHGRGRNVALAGHFLFIPKLRLAVG